MSRLPWAATAGAELDRRLGAYLTERLTLRADGAAVSGHRRADAAGDDRRTASPFSLGGDLPVGARPAAAQRACCSTWRRRTCTSRACAWPDSPASSACCPTPSAPGRSATRRAHAAVGDSLADFLLLGIGHILTGYDHLVFLLGLLLLGGTLRDVVRIVTGFTVAHSLTLALAVFGVLRPERAPIEALIGLSIALVAAENLWLAGGRRPAVRWALAAALLALAARRARAAAAACRR